MDIVSVLKGVDESNAIEKIYEYQNELDNFLKTLKKQLKSVKEQNELELAVWNIYNYMNIDSIKSAFPQYKRGNYFDTLINDLVKYLWKEYVEAGNWVKAIDNLQGFNSIPIMTIHKSKGLEYDTVIFIGLEDDAFWNFVKQPDEDRCAFFVALSRAKRRIDFTFSQNRPTRFTDFQKNVKIKEFYELFRSSAIVDEIDYTK